ncbi:hypothetical protein [Costertonia aggregata]|uniref:Uncharacterized protein n=1 Tax=Costertonia aggregata TaxID=343403 RepID=A0A7H9AN37_9FLAO|nr:hypothetical protein [Costertonia aggregata]QLG44848.1 hypothetical protein HYG79_05605 [Costertonia aggregata]
MKKTIYVRMIISSAVLFLTTLSCSDEKYEEPLEEGALPQKQEETFESSYSLLDYTPNKYYDFFETTDNTIGISILNSGPFVEKSTYKSDQLTAKASEIAYSINDVKFSGVSGSQKLDISDSESYFGKTVVVNFNSKLGTTFKDGSTSKEIEMYVPKQLEILKPLIKNESDLLPFCYFEDFVIEWNADPQNMEGLVVTVEYHGLSAIPENEKKINILNTDFIKEDNGRAVLDNAIWEGIPNTGIVTLTLLRGNVEIEEIDEENYKFFAEARVVLPLILIRDLNTLE